MDSNKWNRGPSSKGRDNKKSTVNDIDYFLKTLRNPSADYKERSYAAKQLGSGYTDIRIVDALLKTVENDPRVRYQALVSLRRIRSQKAEKAFLEHLNDPSQRVRNISILGIGDVGKESAIDPLTTIIETNDYSHLNTGRGGGKGQRTNWGIPENVSAAKEARDKIHQRLQISPPVKLIPESDNLQTDTDPGEMIFPFYPDPESTGDRKITLEMAKQYELNFVGRIEDKLGKTGTVQKISENFFLVESVVIRKDSQIKKLSSKKRKSVR